RSECWVKRGEGGVEASAGDAGALHDIQETALPYVLKADRVQAGGLTAWVLGAGTGPRIAMAVEGHTRLIAELPAAATQDWIAAAAAEGQAV
ncbi:MAG: hypothetical protein AAFY25_11540, partial [Pseudomonadota bacterium]